MSYKCCIPGCLEDQTKSKLTFYPLPDSTNSRNRWILKIRELNHDENWEPNDGTRVCSRCIPLVDGDAQGDGVCFRGTNFHHTNLLPCRDLNLGHGEGQLQPSEQHINLEPTHLKCLGDLFKNDSQNWQAHQEKSHDYSTDTISVSPQCNVIIPNQFNGNPFNLCIQHRTGQELLGSPNLTLRQQSTEEFAYVTNIRQYNSGFSVDSNYRTADTDEHSYDLPTQDTFSNDIFTL